MAESAAPDTGTGVGAGGAVVDDGVVGVGAAEDGAVVEGAGVDVVAEGAGFVVATEAAVADVPSNGFNAVSFAVSGVVQSSATRPPVSPLSGL